MIIDELKELERAIINSTPAKRVQWFTDAGDGLRAVIDHGDPERLDDGQPSQIIAFPVVVRFIDALDNWAVTLSSALALLSYAKESKGYKWRIVGMGRLDVEGYAVEVRLTIPHEIRKQ